MKRIGIGYIYRINERLHPLTQWSGEMDRFAVFSSAHAARQLLEELYNNGNFYGLRTSFPSANRLYNMLAPYVDPKIDDLKNAVSELEISALKTAAAEFEIALVEELNVLPSYLVTPKGGYSLDVLISSPQDFFPADLIPLIPDTEYDVEQAAKCLAFEVPTAAGFHLHRINEAVLRVYWDVVTKGAERPKERSMGVYLAALKKKKKGDAKVRAALQQIKDLHRNPISHPEEKLSVDDAIELHGIIRSSVSKMLVTIRQGKATVVPLAPTLQASSEKKQRVEKAKSSQ